MIDWKEIKQNHPVAYKKWVEFANERKIKKSSAFRELYDFFDNNDHFISIEYNEYEGAVDYKFLINGGRSTWGYCLNRVEAETYAFSMAFSFLNSHLTAFKEVRRLKPSDEEIALWNSLPSEEINP